MGQKKPKYPLNQCALYKCKSKKRLEQILAIETGDLKKIGTVIRYHTFYIDKKDTNEKRHITAPNPKIKQIQSRVLRLIQRVDRPEWLISGEKGKCYIDNGRYHLGSSYVLTMDIKSFYDNCKREYVYTFFRTKMLNEPDIAEILTDIVTFQGGIPTGCPTSQLIAYYAYEDMFKAIQECAAQFGCRFTLYVDDMTFSSQTPFDANRLKREVDLILRKYEHRAKASKSRYYGKEKDKPITGTIVTGKHTLDIPNRLQQQVFENFQATKNLNPAVATEDDEKRVLKLVGQIQAARNIDGNRFPEIKRITSRVQSGMASVKNKKPKHKSSNYKKEKIKLSSN